MAFWVSSILKKNNLFFAARKKKSTPENPENPETQQAEDEVESETEESEDEGEVNPKTNVQIIKLLEKIKKKDPSIYRKDKQFFKGNSLSVPNLRLVIISQRGMTTMRRGRRKRKRRRKRCS